MVWRKLCVIWVPLVGWNEAQDWEGLEDAGKIGFDIDQALLIINTTRETMRGGRYKIQPMEIFLQNRLQ